MTIRKEEEINVHGTEYKIKQLPGTAGARIGARLAKIFFSGAGAVGDIMQDERVKELIGQFFKSSLKITDAVFEDLPPQIRTKLESLKNKEYSDTIELREELSELLSEDERDKYAEIIALKAITGSNNDFSTIISGLGKFVELLKNMIHEVNPDEFEAILSDMINKSVIRYRPQGNEKFEPWINREQNYAFDDHFAGRYGEMLELFVYLALWNYAESLIMLKKNQISTYLQPYLGMLKPEETPEPNE